LKKVACYLWAAPSDRSRSLARDEIRYWLDDQGIGSSEVEWYADHASGDRPELDRLQKDIASGRVAAVVLWKLADLFPRFREGLTTIAAWCERGVRVVAISQGIDLDPAMGPAAASLLRGLAETELEFRRDRQRIGIVAAKKRGVYPGRKPGTTKEKPRKALALRAKGYTVNEIADELGVSKRTAFRYLGLSRKTEDTAARKGAKS
jgi:DNA invertase Pin-like site-specific DNA recombinase